LGNRHDEKARQTAPPTVKSEDARSREVQFQAVELDNAVAVRPGRAGSILSKVYERSLVFCDAAGQNRSGGENFKERLERKGVRKGA